MSHHSSTALRPASTKQRGHESRRLRRVKLAGWRQHEKRLPGTSLSAVQYSTVRDTTDRFGHARHTGRASPCRATGQTRKGSTEIWREVEGGGVGLIPSAHTPPFSEYQVSVYLRNIIISKNNKHKSFFFCAATAHYFPDRCTRDGCRVELQQEMCHLSMLMTERSI